MGAKRRLTVISENPESMPAIITFPYNCVPIPTPTTPKYITTSGQRRQSLNTRRRSFNVHGRTW